MMYSILNFISESLKNCSLKIIVFFYFTPSKHNHNLTVNSSTLACAILPFVSSIWNKKFRI